MTTLSNKPHGFGILRPDTFTPFPKNPIIGAFFREIHRADELGSGMRKLMKYGKIYGGADPEMIEGDVFRIVVKVPEYGEQDPKDMALKAGSAQVTAQVGRFCMESKSAKEIMAELGLTHWKTFQGNYLNPLIDAGILERTIPDKPRSSRQKYRLADTGKRLLASIQNEAEST